MIGSGIAGIAAALAASEHGRVLVVSKGPLDEGNTRWAQGGIAAAVGSSDAPAEHLEDTLTAGAGLCAAEVAEYVVEKAPDAMERLLQWGVGFDRDDDGELRLGREGGHRSARILHAGGDATGREVERALLARVEGVETIRTRSEAFLVDLLDDDGRIVGALLSTASGELRIVRAGATILATGGACRMYRETTNSSVVTGDGIAAAFRAGAVVQDLEFVQFHPTVLYAAGAARFLITEAVRGAGARLTDRDGSPFMDDIHPLADLAPRDVVVRASLARMAETGATNVFLDMTHLATEESRRRFPGVFATCAAVGLDPSTDRIPVRPSAHYFIGGVRTDVGGSSSVPGLWACGETSSSGLHGANRLASNSLLEGLVLGTRAGDSAGRFAADRASADAASVTLPAPGPDADPLDLDDVRNALRSLMGRRAGPQRTGTGLEDARWAIDGWSRYILGRTFRDTAAWELQNLMLLAGLLVTAAGRREESRGTHQRDDFPATDDERWRGRLELRRGEAPRFVPLIPVPAGQAS
ncbi:MAG: L-aspartate oxidase [Planctomycetota bacterium]